MKRTTFVLLLLLVFGGHAKPAAADTIRPGDVLRETFSLPAQPQCLQGECDVILFSFAFANNPVDATSASLFNGSTLLGTFRCQMSENCVAGVPSFVAPGGLYGLHSAVIDFASIRNGTIEGRLDFSVTTPTDVVFGGQNTFVHIGHATQIGVTYSGARATITSEAIVTPTPEPTTVLLFGSGVTALVIRRRTHARRLRPNFD